MRLFYSGVMALILPRLKEITNFVFKLICSSFISKCLRDDMYSSVIHHWNCQLKPYWFSVRKIGLIRVKNYLPISNRVKTVFWSEMKGVAKIKRYCHFGMAKIRLFYSGAMALILPWLKDITNFVLKLICSLLIFKCLRGDLYSSMIHYWNCQLKPYWFPVRKNRLN